MLTWKSPEAIGAGFKPQIAVRPDGSYLVTAQINSTGITAQEFNPAGDKVGGNALIIPTNGGSFDGHFAAWASGKLHMFYTPSSPRRLLYTTDNGLKNFDVGQKVFGSSGAVFNDNAVCADGDNLYLAVKRYGQPDEIVILIPFFDTFADLARYPGTKTPRICAKGDLIASFARSNQAEPAQSEFNWVVLKGSQKFSGSIILPGEEINGGMEVATNGSSVVFAFARDDIRLYRFQNGAVSPHVVVLDNVGDVAGDGLDIVALPDGSYCLMWNDKATCKAYYALEREGWVRRELWNIGGSASTTLEAEAIVTPYRVIWAAVGGNARELYASSAQIAEEKREVKIMFSGATYAGADPQTARIYDSRNTGQKLIDKQVVPIDTGRPKAKAVAVTLTANGATGGGHFRAFGAGEPLAPTSVLNYDTMPKSIANTTIVNLSEGKFNVYCGGQSAHLIIDVVGFFEVKEE